MMSAATRVTAGWCVGALVLAGMLGCVQRQAPAAPAPRPAPAAREVSEVKLVPDVGPDASVDADDLAKAVEVIEARLDGVAGVEAKAEEDGSITLSVLADADRDRVIALATRKGELKLILAPEGVHPDRRNGERVWLDAETGKEVPEATVLRSGEVVCTGADLAPTADVGTGQKPGEWQVQFEIKEERKADFKQLTGEHVGDAVAFVVDSEVLMAPIIRSAISGKGVIDGDFSLEEAEDLAKILNSGPLPLALRVAGEEAETDQSTDAEADETEMATDADKYGMREGTIVKIETTKGDIVVELFDEDAPETVANFKKLIEKRFYDGLTFHRSDDMCIQGGCPKGDGTGGPGWCIDLEISGHKNTAGALAMARSADPNSAGCQFYILKRAASHLDGQYAVFGTTIEGMELVPKMRPGDVMKAVSIIRGPKAE